MNNVSNNECSDVLCNFVDKLKDESTLCACPTKPRIASYCAELLRTNIYLGYLPSQVALNPQELNAILMYFSAEKGTSWFACLYCAVNTSNPVKANSTIDFTLMTRWRMRYGGESCRSSLTSTCSHRAYQGRGSQTVRMASFSDKVPNIVEMCPARRWCRFLLPKTPLWYIRCR